MQVGESCVCIFGVKFIVYLGKMATVGRQQFSLGDNILYSFETQITICFFYSERYKISILDHVDNIQNYMFIYFHSKIGVFNNNITNAIILNWKGSLILHWISNINYDVLPEVRPPSTLYLNKSYGSQQTLQYCCE